MLAAATREVVITGLGAVSALGHDAATLWSSIESGRCGISAIRRFSTAAYGVHTGAEVESAAKDGDATMLCLDFAIRAAREAIADADVAGAPADRVALVFGTGLTDSRELLQDVLESFAVSLGVLGPRLCVSTACSSSTAAIGVGRDLLALDAADVVIAGGSDVLTAEVFSGFRALGVLASGCCAPFSSSVGTTLGEGAGFLVLERAHEATQRGAHIRARLAGYGLSGDAWHETSPDPKGNGIRRAISAALLDAAAEPGSVGFVNAHGSGTQANDAAEWLGIRQALGPGADEVPVSSTKGALGHAQGAAGALEAIVTILAMERAVIPPTLNFEAARPHGPPDPVGQQRPRPHVVTRAVSVNAAFGGANAAIVIDRDSRHRAPPSAMRRPVYVRGIGLVGPFGCGIDSFRSAPHLARRGLGTVPSFDFATHLPSIDPRAMDRSAVHLSTAVALGLTDAGVQVRGALRDRAGLVVGQRRPSPVSLRAFADSIAARGLPGLSAVAFARIVLNAAAGTCSKVHSLRGPLSALTTGAGSSLTAMVLAAELLATRDDVDVMAAAGVDEIPATDSSLLDAAGTDVAACVILSRAPLPGAPPIALAGWGVAGPRHGGAAAARALAGKSAAGVHYVCVDDWAGESASGAMLGLSDILLTMRDGAPQSVLLVCEAGDAISTALLLERGT